MRKTTVIKAGLSLAVFYVFLQIFSLKNLFKRRDGVQGKDEKTTMLDLVYEFSSLAHQHHVSVFVIEPLVLQSIVSVSQLNSGDTCVHLCRSGDVLSLGIFATDWEKRGDLILNLPKYDLIASEITSPDPRQFSAETTSISSSIPTHYFIRYTSRVRPIIHLVVFYQRADNFVWHSKLQLTNKTQGLGLVSENLSFGKHAGAYDRFPTRSVRVDGMSLDLPHTVKEFLAQVPQSTFIECDYQQARTFLAKYPQDTATETQQFQRKGRQLLSRAKDILNELGVRFWLSSGTCLGWLRQCGIISYSKDLDFGVRIKDYQEDIVPAFESRGFTLKHIFGKETDSYELSFKAGDIKIDLFFFYEEESYMWNGGTDYITGQKYKYYFPKFDVCWTEFLGLRVRVPCPTLPYVTANYGQNWNTPVPQWDWKHSPPNVKENGKWPQEEWEDVMQVYQ